MRKTKDKDLKAKSFDIFELLRRTFGGVFYAHIPRIVKNIGQMFLKVEAHHLLLTTLFYINRFSNAKILNKID